MEAETGADKKVARVERIDFEEKDRREEGGGRHVEEGPAEAQMMGTIRGWGRYNKSTVTFPRKIDCHVFFCQAAAIKRSDGGIWVAIGVFDF